MRIEKRSMNWMPKPSLYQEAAAKRAKQKSANQAFLSTQSNLAATIGDISSFKVQGTTDIASNIALARLSNKKA